MVAPATRELTDADIDTQYGDLLARASAAFRDDPSYLVDMAESASLIVYKRQLWEAKAEAAALHSEPAAIKAFAADLMLSRNQHAPRKTGRRRRVA